MSNISAEHKLIAICAFNSDLIRDASATVSGDMFHRANMQAAWEIMVEAKKSDNPIGPTEFYEVMKGAGIRGIEPGDIHIWRDAIHNEGYQTVERLAQSIQEDWSDAATNAAWTRYLADPSAQARSQLIQDLQAISTNTAGNFLKTKKLREILEQEDGDYDWIVEGLMERGDRLMLTGGEGAGKSTFVRQMALCLAAGIHPFQLKDIPPVKVLVIDAENSEKQWRRATKKLAENIMAGRPQQDPRDIVDIICLVDEGVALDITREAHLSAIHRMIDKTQPDIVFIGPLYKITSKAIQTDDEATPVLRALDSIRARGCALVIEAHAGKSTNAAGDRNLAPRGSSALLGWPEFGIGLALNEEESVFNESTQDFDLRVVELTRWRGDRDRREWPGTIQSSGPLSWNPMKNAALPYDVRARFYSNTSGH